MSDYMIGAGGWAYFNIPGMNPLEAYSRAFDFVEVNSTFYQLPSDNTIDSWATKVPGNFKFSLRCHKDLTHKYTLSPVEQACQILEKHIRICQRLGSQLLVLETPRSFDPNKTLPKIQDLMSSISFNDVRIVWEIRWGPPGDKLIRLMQDFDIVHSVDLSRETNPAYESNILYSRLFGHGWHNLYQFDDSELLDIDTRASSQSVDNIYLSFHGGRMYKDAARLKKFKRDGSFPGVTRNTGVEALQEVLTEDARFPATRQELIDSQGWKVIDMSRDHRVHAKVLLEKLTDDKYESIGDVINNIRL